MGRCYGHLNLAERRKLAALLEAKVPVSAIAAELGRHRSTIHREIARNFFHTAFRDRWGQDYRGYYAVAGHSMAQRRRTGQAELLRRPALRDHVLARLRDGWSPQQIAGRLRREGHPEGSVSHETIYRHVYSRRGREEGLYALLATARRQRRRRFGRKPRATPIPSERSIAARPEHIATREEFGHWEGDLVIFARRLGGANVTSLQERQSRFVMLVGNDDKRASTVAKGIDAKLTPLPACARRSMTFDRGTEFLGYPGLATQVWFCDPHSPWQKGGVENANGRLRRFLPLDSAPGDRTPAALAVLAQKLNATPRRCLRYRTPAEVFAEALSQLASST
jgi:IS30 family transposase